MLFNSINFLLFFPIVTFIYFVIPHKVRYIWLLLASYFFYMCWNPLYSLLLLLSTAITYAGGLLINYNIGGKKYPNIKKFWVAVAIISNLAILAWFKYFYFVVENINVVLGFLNITLIQPKFDIILPVGISFYTFQALSYILDIYREQVEVEKNFLRYALFVSFFPQLVAGPIERSKNLLPQLKEKHYFDFDKMRSGLLLMLYGYFLKMVIADRAAILVDFVFDNYEAYSGFEIVITIAIFLIQEYADFAGYSAIAIGAAEVMGFTLMQNFNHPYFAKSIQEFWTRWHISMITWFRDYVYYPILFAYNGISKIKIYAATMIVFIISGIWHGAGWNFIIWGVIHGIYLSAADFTKPYVAKINKFLGINTKTFSYGLMQIITTLALVGFSDLIFRAKDLHTAWEMLKQMFSSFNLWIFFDGSLYKMGLDRDDFWMLMFSTFILWSVSMLQEHMKLRKKLAEQGIIFRYLVYISAVVFVVVFGIYGPGYDARQFIYFQF